MGIDYEEKAFYDILKAVSKKYEFEYPDDKMIELSKRIKTIVDDKSRYTDWSTREDIKANLQVDLILLLDEFDYAKAKLEAQSELQYEDLSDYEIPPRTQFSMLKKPAVSIKYKEITFNMTCVRMFEGIESNMPWMKRAKNCCESFILSLI